MSYHNDSYGSSINDSKPYLFIFFIRTDSTSLFQFQKKTTIKQL